LYTVDAGWMYIDTADSRCTGKGSYGCGGTWKGMTHNSLSDENRWANHGV